MRAPWRINAPLRHTAKGAAGILKAITPEIRPCSRFQMDFATLLSARAWGGGVSVCLTSWCTAECRHLSAAVTCSAWSCCAQWISSHWGRRCRESRCYWPAGCSRGASPSGPWSTDARPSSFGGRTRQWCIPARSAAESVNVVEQSVTSREKRKKLLTISVSETGPKLVTKMLVLISVTFSVNIEERCVSICYRAFVILKTEPVQIAGSPFHLL